MPSWPLDPALGSLFPAGLCGSGYRSSIAASLLESEGFDQLINVMGGMHAVRHAKRPRIPVMELADNAIAWEI
jgi:rhodanese-related sulfurtransferase